MIPRRLWLPLLVLSLHPLAAQPEAKPLEHYQSLLQQSPFAVASAAPTPAPVVSETASFANDYYVVGMAQLGETPFVTISTRDRQKRFSLLVGETSAEGITVEGVEWASEIGRSRVTLRRGGELGVISFDEAAMKVAAPPTPSPTPEEGRRGRRGWGDRRMVMPGQQEGRPFQWSQNQEDREERRRQWRRRREAIRNAPQQ